MSVKLDDKRRLKLAAQGLRRTAISLQAAVVSLLQTADALIAEPDDNLVEYSPLDVNLQDLLKGDINNALIKLLNDALNDGELDEDQRTQQNGKRAANGVKKPTRKPRPPRDPNAPTKPQNAFILFQKDIASQVKAENTGKPWSEIVHLISTRWKALPREEKEVYEHRFEEAKQKFEAEYKIYLENKDQGVATADPDAHEEHNDTSESATAESQSTASQSEEDDEEDTPNPSASRAMRSKAATKSSAPAKNTPESSSKKRSKKRKPQEDDDDESAHEEEDHYELSKKSKKKALNEEGGDVQVKDRKKNKKSSREEDKDLDLDDKPSKKKKIKKTKLE
uniref:Non-histone chromosomal protein 6 n=1 Tax=Anthurium amnicola TaxID=1678845 RepID=A0A1D1Y8I0_9ARAE